MGNISRLLGEGQSLRIDWTAWEPLPIFKLIQSTGGVTDADMRRTFNLGIGWVFVISPGGLSDLESALDSSGEMHTIIGEVIAS